MTPTPTPQGTLYRYLVEMDGPPGTRKGTLYDGTDAADAMAAFSKAITEGRLYVTLEALRHGPVGRPNQASLLAAKDGDPR